MSSVHQLLMFPCPAVTPRPRTRSKRKDVGFNLYSLMVFFRLMCLKIQAREIQLHLLEQEFQAALSRLADFQDENQWLKAEVKRVSRPAEKRTNRKYNKTCQNCQQAFISGSFDRLYCDACREVGQQRRKGFNRSKNGPKGG